MIRKLLKRWALAMATVTSVALLPHGAAAAEARTVLEEILNMMRQSAQITEEQRKALLERAEREAREAKAEREQVEADRVAALTAGVENARPFLRSADGNFKIELGGRLHVDYDAAEGKARTLTGATLNDEFLVRRARIELTATFFKWILLQLEDELAQTPGSVASTLKGAYLDFRFRPEIALRAGQFKVPYSLDQLSSANFIDFVERSVVDELAPGYDFGAALHGSLVGGVASYMFGVFNGNGQNNSDNNSGKDIAGRVVVAPFKPGGDYWLTGLQLGGDFTWGDQDTGTSARGRTTARTANRFTYFGAQSTRGDRTRWGTDLAWAVGPAAVKFEYDRQMNQRTRLGSNGQSLDDVTATGWYVTGTWLLTGEERPLNRSVIPKRPFFPVAGQFGPGAWELALRYAELKFSSDDPVDFFDGNINNGITGGGTTAENGVEALTAGVNWYLNSRVRYMLNWTQYWYDNPLGTPFSCEQVSCTATQLRRRGDATSWELLSRIQLWF